ncbi:Thrombospondin type-1 domain-containing protein 7A [Nymphon striatum]|nr:Thrombospondin type-1 domain-containing protein 7A [Nymphon striatum]
MPGNRAKNQVDYILVNRHTNLTNVEVLNRVTGSDHRMVRATICINVKSDRTKLIMTRHIPVVATQDQIDQYRLELTNSLQVFAVVDEDIDQANSQLIKTMKDAAKKANPTCNQSLNKFSATTLSLMNRRNDLIIRNSEDLLEKRDLNKTIHKRQRTETRAYNQRIVETTIKEGKGYKTAKKRLAIGNRQIASLKNADGEIVTDREEILRIGERFYQTLYTSSLNIHPTYSFSEDEEDPIPDITRIEVESAIKTLKSGKSAGEDGISSTLIKKGGSLMAIQLAQLFTNCLRQKKIPKSCCHDSRDVETSESIADTSTTTFSLPRPHQKYCGYGTRKRNVICKRSDGHVVDIINCLMANLTESVSGIHDLQWLVTVKNHQIEETCFVPCPGDCVMSEWSPWSHCHRNCENGEEVGIQTKSRAILAYPKNNGEKCPKTLYETKPCIGNVRTAFDRKEKGESAALMEEVMKCLESLESLWGDFESGLGVTARLWSMYIDMMLILRRYIHAERAGLWQQHLQEVRNMLPYTIASGHSKYMSCLPIYLNEMQKLPETAPEVHEEFAAGKFTVHQTAGDFNGVWTDLAMAFIQRFNTLGLSTFGQLQERYRDKLLNMKPRHCTEVHFVGDQYDFELKSLKSDERQRQESNMNLPEYVPADSMKIPDWKTLLSNPCNRTNMLSYLASRWSQEASWPAGFCLVLGVNAQATRVTQTEHTDVDELYCPNHEEADTRIFAHIASCDDNNVFVIQATDTDIIFLAMYHFPRLPNVVELWVEKNDMFLSIHDLVNELAKAVGKDVLALTDTLLISYILSGCDSVSYPFKRGKKRTVKVALEHVDKHPTLSNCIRHESGPSAHDQVITEARSFFCDLYGKPGYLSLDKLRAHLFASSKLDLRSLPPTEDAFHFHVLRSLCQICLYKQASLSNPVLLPPEEYGRIVDGDRLIPFMKSKPSKPSAAKLKYCKCKKKPNCLRNCPCAKAAVPCIIACACNGDREKCGRLLTDHYDDDDDDDDDDEEILSVGCAINRPRLSQLTEPARYVDLNFIKDGLFEANTTEYNGYNTIKAPTNDCNQTLLDSLDEP